MRILALIHRTGAQLPQKRIELYKLATDTLARTWRPAQGVPESALITDEYLTPMLSKLAFWLHTHKPTGIATENEVYNVLGEEWARMNDLQWDEDDTVPKIKEEVRKFLLAVREHTGLFVERAPKRYGFMHLTFEEYYAARYLVARSRSRARLIREHLHDPRWEEPILLALGFVGLESPEEAAGLVEAAILAEGEDAKELQFTASPYEDLLGRDYLFALRCLGDNIPMRSRVQNKLTSRLIDELKSWTGPARFLKYRDTLAERLKFLEGSKIVPVLLECLQEGLKHVPPDLYYLRESPVKIFNQWSQIPPEVFTIILQALRDKDPNVRSQAAINLLFVQSAPPKVISALVQRIHDDNKRIRADALVCLLSLKSSTSRLDAVVFQALQDDDAWVRRQAVVGLAQTLRTSPKVMDALVLALQDDYRDTRQWAAYGLGKRGKTSPEIEKGLRQLLLEGEQEVRNVAALALGQLGYLSTDVILALLRIPEYDKRLGGRDAAKKLLNQLDFVSSEAFVTLLSALHDGDTRKRQEAALCLGGVYKAVPEILVALVASLEDENQSVRQATAQSLGILGEATPEVVLGLLRSLHDNNSRVRQAAAQSLGRLGRATPEIVAVLTETLNAGNLQERIIAALSLARLGQVTPDATRVLLEGFPQITDNEERRQIARSLGKMGQGDEPTVNLLIRGLIEPHFYLRFSCSRALVLLGRRFTEAQNMILRELVLAINSPEFDKQDSTRRSGHDHAHEALWRLIAGGDIPKDEE